MPTGCFAVLIRSIGLFPIKCVYITTGGHCQGRPVVGLNDLCYNITNRYNNIDITKCAMARAVSIRHLILGLLTQQPMSGYDIKGFLKSLSWLIDSPSFGSIYPALRALREDDLVTMMEVVPRQGKPPRKIYTITETGRQILREWLDQPVAPDASLKTFVMRLIMTSNFTHTELISHLQQRRSQVAVHHTTLRQIAEVVDGTMDSGQRLTLDYGLTLATAELAWLERALEQLSQQPLPAEVVKGDGVTMKI